MRMSQFCGAAVAALVVVGCSKPLPSGLVRQMDPGSVAHERPPLIMGREFRPLLAPGMWACGGAYNDARAKKLGQGLLPRPDWPLFRDCALTVSGLKYAAPRIMGRVTRPDTWHWEPGDRRLPADKPIELSEFFTENLLWPITDNPKREVPLFAMLACARPGYFLDDSYRENIEKYRAWAKENPNFTGFVVQAEHESDIGWYMQGVNDVTNEFVRARMSRDFPVPRDQRELADFVRKTWARVRKIHFGEDRLWALSAGTYSFSHLHAANGADGLFSECSAAQQLARWQLAMAFLRGAARQFSIPFGLYAAHFYGGFDRKGKYKFGENKWSRYPWSENEPDPNDTHYPHIGLSRSIVDRENAYAWFSGASFLMPENDAGLYFKLRPDGTYRPSEYAEDMNALYELTQRVDRGIPHTPLALLVPMGELYGHSIHGRFEEKGKGFWFDDVFSQDAFYHTLVPVTAPNETARRRAGREGCLFNSPFGDSYDVLAADSGQDSAAFARALGRYRCAFLIGGFRKADTDLAALESFVRGGGTLVLPADRVREGFVSRELSGLMVVDGLEPSGRRLRDDRGCVTDLTEDYDWMRAVSCGAKPCLTDENGHVAVWTNDIGKGRVVTVASWRMLPRGYRGVRETLTDFAPKTVARYEKMWNEILSGERRFSLIRALLGRVQEETSPFAVRGNVQFGFNRLPDGWILWLINNDGVTHYSFEPESFDAAKTATVTVSARGSRMTVTDQVSGENVAANALSVDLEVGPGRWRIFKITK